MTSKKSATISNLIRRVVNPPLPLNARQSKQLGNSLSKSFRQQLDQEHGDGKSSSAHTDAHLANILSNPHFAATPRHRARSASPNRRQSLAELQTELFRPVEKFMKEVAAGEATLKSAKQCMKDYDLLSSTKAGSNERRPGQVIANWLWSTGLEDSLEFIYHKEFVDLLIQHLYLEQKQSRVDTWLYSMRSRLSNSASSTDSTFVQHSGALLARHIRTASDHLGLENAVALFNKHTPTTEIVLYQKFRAPAGAFLVTALEKNAALEQARPIDANIYSQFVEAVPSWQYQSASRDSILATLALIHPTQPSPDLAVSFLNGIDHKLSQGSKYSLSAKAHDKVISLYVHTFEWLRKNGRSEEASSLTNGLSRILPSEDVHATNLKGDVSSLLTPFRKRSIDVRAQPA